MFNTSILDNKQTANTHYICAKQRAENLYSLGAKSVLELCVGPSLSVLEKAYKKYEISVTGNDIDKFAHTLSNNFEIVPLKIK